MSTPAAQMMNSLVPAIGEPIKEVMPNRWHTTGLWVAPAVIICLMAYYALLSAQ